MLSPHAAHVGPTPVAALHALAQRIVELCHAKTRTMPNGQLPDAPIGRGGKKDDTSCVVAEAQGACKQEFFEWLPCADLAFGPRSSCSGFFRHAKVRGNGTESSSWASFGAVMGGGRKLKKGDNTCATTIILSS